jgi:hypothetical protein
LRPVTNQKSRWVAAAVQWLPLAAVLAYAALLVSDLRRVLGAVYASSDAASPPMIAACLARRCASGHVMLGHISYYTTLWFDWAASWLPFHRLIWQAGPIALWLAGITLLAWTVAGLSGRWAAAMTVAVALPASWAMLRASVAPAFHGTTWFATIALGSLVACGRRLPTGFLIGFSVLVGVNLASDPLLALVGLLPVVLAPLWLRVRTRDAAYGAALRLGLTVAGLAAAAAAATDIAMQALGISAVPFPLGRAALAEVPGRALRFGADLGSLLNIGPLSAVLVAVGAIVAGFWLYSGRAHPAREKLFAAYWAISAVALALGFVGGNAPLGSGTPSSRYLGGLVYAAAALLPVVAHANRQARLSASLAIVTLGALSCVSLAAGNPPQSGSTGTAIASYERQALATLDRLGLRVGYAQYWKAGVLTWLSDGRILVAPVSACGTRLCPYRLNSIAGWYSSWRPIRTFVLYDVYTDRFGPAVLRLGRPSEIRVFGPLRVRTYTYDVARRFADAAPAPLRR